MSVSSKMKPSAYRSMWLGRENKNKTENGGLRKWIDEDWRNLTPYALGLTSIKDTPKCGTRHPKQGNNPSVCRPFKEINKYTKQQIQKAIELKKKGKIIQWKKL